jgi:hypothetical protein
MIDRPIAPEPDRPLPMTELPHDVKEEEATRSMSVVSADWWRWWLGSESVVVALMMMMIVMAKASSTMTMTMTMTMMIENVQVTMQYRPLLLLLPLLPLLGYYYGQWHWRCCSVLQMHLIAWP